MKNKLTIDLKEALYAVCRLGSKSEIPKWATQGDFFSISKTEDELSVVCEELQVPEGIRAEKGWRCFKVLGPLDFSLTGVMASLANPLAEAKISVFTISTFDTDYLLVRKENLEAAVKCLESQGGHTILTVSAKLNE